LQLKSFALAPQESGGDIRENISVKIENPDACPRYLGRLIRGVTIAESPEWLKRRILSCGLRPVNNIVDITNYIMLLFGQPMHAFDYAGISGGKIVVKNAFDGQTFVTLDDVERKLGAGDLLICDGERAVALAGIMGGADSRISPDTRDVFLECAFFNPVGIRKTSRRLDLSSDSSYRFERGVDPAAGLAAAIDTAAELTRRLGGGTIVSGIIDASPVALPARRVCMRPSQAVRILGVDLDKDRIISMLASLGITHDGEENGAPVFKIPMHRHDISIEADLIEEVGRLYGYDNIPAAQTAMVPMTRQVNPARAAIDTLRKALAFAGLHEAVTNSMTSQKLRDLLSPDTEPVALLNPLNPDMALMRTTLAGGLLGVAAHNLSRKNANNHFFEIGKTFVSRGPSQLPDERDVAGILLEGSFEPQSWRGPRRPVDFYILKSLVETAVRHIGGAQAQYSGPECSAAYLDHESAAISFHNGVHGVIGRIRDDICAQFDITPPVYYAQIDFTALLEAPAAAPSYIPLPRFPAVERDFCFVMPEQIQSSVISREIASCSNLVEWVEPFDVYRGEKLGQELKSLAFAVRLRAPDKTLTDADADTVCKQIISVMREKHAAVLRT
jgi:phenylalanyl-tRNA synthetase beta chain